MKPKPASTRLPFAGGSLDAQPAAAPTSNKTTDPAILLLAGGIMAALLLIVIATWVPSTRLRATIAGRVAFDHQTDLVVAGIAMLLVTVLVYLLSRT